MNSYQKLRKRAYEILEVAKSGDRASRAVDMLLICLICLNVILVIADTFEFPAVIAATAFWIENISMVVFSIEYLLRVWTACEMYPQLSPIRARLKYIISFQALVDLISLLPYFVTFISANLIVLRMFKILRLLRVFKVNRYTNALRDIGGVFRKKASQLISSMVVVAVLMVIASVLMYDAEHDAQPDKFDNALSGMWWAISTLTTVGYGDIYPITLMGKIMSAIIALLGIGLVAVPTGIITAGFSEQITEKAKKADTYIISDETTAAILSRLDKLDTVQRAKLLVYADNLSGKQNESEKNICREKQKFNLE